MKWRARVAVEMNAGNIVGATDKPMTVMGVKL